MKFSAILVIALSLASASAFAGSYQIKSLPEDQAKIDLARVTDSIVVGKNAEKGIKVRVVTTDLGGSTDVSARYELFLTYFHAGEMLNTRTSFSLGEILELKRVKRIGAGVYEVKVLVYEPVGEGSAMIERTLIVDTARVFEDDRNLALEEFADKYFESSVKVIRSDKVIR